MCKKEKAVYAFGEFETVSNPGSNREKGTPPMEKQNTPVAVASTNAMKVWRTGRDPWSKSGYRSCLRTRSRNFWVGKNRGKVRMGEHTGTATERRDDSR